MKAAVEDDAAVWADQIREARRLSTQVAETAAPYTLSSTNLGDEMTRSIAWEHVTDADVVRAIEEYDRLGPEQFFSEHGFAPTTTYDLVWEKRRYPPKAILGTAYELATGERLASADFEGGKSGAVRVLEQLGFTIEPR